MDKQTDGGDCITSRANMVGNNYWLPVQWHIKFKLASLTFKVMHIGTPLYLSHLLIPYCPSHVLRSPSSSNLLQVPYTNLIFGSCSFCIAVQTI